MSKLIRLPSRLLNIAGGCRVNGKASFSGSVKLVKSNCGKSLIDCGHLKMFIKPTISGCNLNHFSTQSSDPKNILNPDERITVSEYKKIVDSGEKHLLIDVRPAEDADVVKLDQAINLPLKKLLHEEGLKHFEKLSEQIIKDGGKVYVMCRKGIASQIAVKYLKEKTSENVEIKDIVGGLTAWSKEIDSSIRID
ncbi:uncharacterized protein LOC128391290 [Panonychus citri]|uniref:uncharacterized protein LOC128391290 n=1 Tax=Panonychus citri TaxID=50023 RepID=UPI00230786EA|nr:uncharacterized protein LOC128391290 [Panonychus citri]